MKKVLSLFLVLLMVLSAVACKKDTGNEENTEPITTKEPGEVEGDPNSRENIQDDLPEMDFGNEVLKIGYTVDAYDNLYGSVGSESDSDEVAHEVYKRNRAVQDRFNCAFDFVAFGESKWDEVNATVYNQILTGGDTCCDIFMCTEHQLNQGKIYNMFADCGDLEYINTDKPYWWTDMMMECSLNGSTMPFLMGDISMLSYLKMGIIYYNKNLYSSYNGGADPDEIYQLVLDGKWTLDELMTMSKDIYVDVNNNGNRDGADRYGMAVGGAEAEYAEYLHFLLGCDLTLYNREYVSKVGMEIPVIAMNNERVRNSVEKLHNLMGQDGVYFNPDLTIDNNAYCFSQGLLLFYPGRFSAAHDGSLKEMTDKYGVLPMPKYDTDQENYVSYVHDSSSAVALPVGKSEETYRMASVVLEAMACYNYKNTAPILLDKLLAGRYASDGMTAEVVDIVVKSATKNFVSENLGATNNIVYTMTLGVKENNFLHYYNESASQANGDLQRYIISLFS